MSGFVELLVLLFLHKKNLFDTGSILTFVPTFPSGLILLFWLEIIFTLVEGGHFPNFL